MMTNLGLHQGNGRPIADTGHTPPDKYPSISDITLGSGSVSPLTLASAYNTIASGGTYCVPTPVLSITTSEKKSLTLNKNRCRNAVEPDVANGVTQILKNVLTKGTAAGIGGLAGGRPVAGKTGTSDGSNETWFVGYTPQLTTAVWVGTPDGSPTRVLRNLNLGGTFYGGQIFGATVAAPTWKLIMDRASAGMPVLDFAGPGSKVQSGDLVPIPNVIGMNVNDAMAALAAAGFQPQVGGTVGSSYPVGTVVGTKPELQALRGSQIVIVTSAGFVRPPAPQVTTSPAANPRNRTPVSKLPKCRPGGPLPCRN
jgi:membrane peptidoglycan carboxypeptidase